MVLRSEDQVSLQPVYFPPTVAKLREVALNTLRSSVTPCGGLLMRALVERP